jgi:hypothetical protein
LSKVNNLASQISHIQSEKVSGGRTMAGYIHEGQDQEQLVNIGTIDFRPKGDGNWVFAPNGILGVIFLGVLTILLLIALQRAHALNRELMMQLKGKNQ